MRLQWDWPDNREMRVRVCFLFFPKRLLKEWRWLEWVAIVQLRTWRNGRYRWADKGFASEL